MTVKTVLCSLVIAAGLGAPAAGQAAVAPNDTAKTTVVKHLLQLTGAVNIMQKAIANLIPAERASNPTIPPAFWDAFMARVNRDVPILADSLVTIYTKRFSLDELKQLEQFYESPVGKHLAAAQPEMLQESMQIGQRWGAAIGKEIADSLQGTGNR